MAVAKKHIEPVAGFASLFDKVSAKLPGKSNAELLALRKARFDRFMTVGLPTQRSEPWKYTNLPKFANIAMTMAPRVNIGLSELSRHFAGGPTARRLIFINGHFVPELSHARGLPDGVRAVGLETMLEQDPKAVIEALSQGGADRSMSDLNLSFLQSGAWIEVPEDVQIDQPLQLLFVNVGQEGAVMTSPRIVVRLGARSRLHLIESHVGVREGSGLTNLVGQVALGEDARMVHDRIQLCRDGTSFVGKFEIELATRAHFTQTLATFGGAMVRNETEARLTGPDIHATFNGTYLPGGQEHVDNVMLIHHEAPDCESYQFYKGVADGKARAAFAGKIKVHQPAQRTNAYQANNNMLLSDDAEIDSKPELEIYADDVKCSHGSTCGDLDEIALFYLRSRGIDAGAARGLLTYAFLAEVIERFGDEAVRRQANEALFARLPGGETLRGMSDEAAA